MPHRKPHLFTLLCLASSALAFAAPAGAQGGGDEETYTNLQILPIDIGKEELMAVMGGFSSALGVRCDHCHVFEADKRDFASDDKETKRVARGMMLLTRSINDSLGTAIGRQEVAKVECITCHRGQAEPRTLRGVLVETSAKDGTEAAVVKYRELREQYYGRGGYDFGENSLIETVQELEKGKAEPAALLPLLQLNLEFFPQSANTHVQLGRLLIKQGKKDEAMPHFDEAKKLQPDNRWLLRQIQELTHEGEGVK
jgi:tetratricopeptide (TPR) repeat protein